MQAKFVCLCGLLTCLLYCRYLVHPTFYLFSDFTGVEIGVTNRKVAFECDGRRLNLKSLQLDAIIMPMPPDHAFDGNLDWW